MNLNKIFKRQQYEKQRNFEKRAKEFHIEYKLLVEKHGCDFAGFIVPLDVEGRSAMAKLRIIDVKEKIDKDKEAEAEQKAVE